MPTERTIFWLRMVIHSKGHRPPPIHVLGNGFEAASPPYNRSIAIPSCVRTMESHADRYLSGLFEGFLGSKIKTLNAGHKKQKDRAIEFQSFTILQPSRCRCDSCKTGFEDMRLSVYRFLRFLSTWKS